MVEMVWGGRWETQGWRVAHVISHRVENALGFPAPAFAISSALDNFDGHPCALPSTGGAGALCQVVQVASASHLVIGAPLDRSITSP